MTYKAILNRIRIIFLAIATLAAVSTGAQNEENKRPKIGLVLSGGGAKGLAHVGILQAIDSAGLKIDYITGTSMGAIIAGMYAGGYNAKQIRESAAKMDWMSAITSGSTKYEDLTIDAKDEFDNYIVQVPVDKGFKMKISTGVLEPIEVMLKLEEIFFPFYKSKNFNDLNIPFKCIATDLRDGTGIVLDKGDLAFATRSSMAIPGVFSATNYKNTKLVDGGVVRNFPVQDAIDMGADYVIGVNLFNGLNDPNDLTNMLDVMNQIINFQDASDLIKEKSMCDMILEPNVTKYSAGSFGSSDVILAIGDSIGREFYPLFKQLADSLYNGYGLDYINPDERMPEYNEKVQITKFAFEGLKNTNSELLIHNLDMQLGREYTVQEINDAIRRAMSSQYYSNIRYELEATNNKNGVCIRLIVDERPLSLINVALSYNTFTDASLILGYTRKNLIGERSITDAKIAISQSMRARVYHRFYFGRDLSKFVQAKYTFASYEIPRYDGKEKKAQYDYYHNSIAATVGHIKTKTRDTKFTIGFETFRLKKDVAQEEVAYDGKINNIFVNLKTRHNTLNRRFLPQKGVETEFNVYSAIRPRYKNIPEFKDRRNNIVRITGDWLLCQQITPRASIFENFAGAISYGDRMLVHQTFLGGSNKFLPSHFKFTGLNTAQLQESTIAMARFGFQYQVLGELYGIIQLNTAATYYSLDRYIGPDRDTDIDIAPKRWIHGIGATVAYNLSFLPFDISLFYSPDYKFNVNVNVGFCF